MGPASVRGCPSVGSALPRTTGCTTARHLFASLMRARPCPLHRWEQCQRLLQGQALQRRRLGPPSLLLCRDCAVWSNAAALMDAALETGLHLLRPAE